MRHIVFAALYTALACLANASVAQDLEGLRTGDMRKLIVHSELQRGSDVAFTGEDGSEMTMSDYAGKWVVLNFWATWCAPCRIEMPHLSQLQADYGGDDFAVVTVATGRNQPQAMQAFLDEIGVDNLPLHTDPRQSLARDFGVLGLPVTVILTPDGQEFARLQGEADWSAPEAYAVIDALLASGS